MASDRAAARPGCPPAQAGSRGRGQGFAQGLAQGLALALALALGGGCGEGDPLTLVALRGCGLEQEFSALRVRVVGDLPASAGTELLLGPGEAGSIEALPEGARGVVAQGLFGTTVTALGRSWGIDPAALEGRVPGVERDGLPLWFAAPDSQCALGPSPRARTELGVGVGPLADVLLAGGRDAEGALLDELAHLDLLSEELRTLSPALPRPLRAPQVWSAGGRRFVVFGGGAPGASSATIFQLDLDAPASLDASAQLRVDGQPWSRAGYASAASGAGQPVLLAGGCAQLDEQGRCALGSVSSASAWFDARSLGTQPLPSLNTARADAQAFVSVDGVAFVAGGLGAAGEGLGSLERLRPGADSWETLVELPDRVVGLTVLDGGLALLVDELGQLHGWSEAGGGVLDPSSRAPALTASSEARPLARLPGERVVVGRWLFSPATAAVDPALERVSLASTERVAAASRLLADGTLLVVGGVDPEPGTPSSPALARVRPKLDGPDEWIPELTGPQTDAFIGNAPGRAQVSVGGLRLEGLAGGDLARVRAHVRGFRSASFRLEFGFEGEPGVTPELILGHGASALLSLSLEPSPQVRMREADGSVRALGCAPGEGQLGEQVVVELAEGGRALRVADVDDRAVLDCALDWDLGQQGAYVGFGARGEGSARFFGLRLARVGF